MRPTGLGSVLPAEEQERRMAMYKRGCPDEMIGNAGGFTRCCIRHWRQRYNLPANDKRGGDRRSKEYQEKTKLLRGEAAND